MRCSHWSSRVCSADVVTQKNWKVRFSMHLNSGCSAGRCPATSCCTDSGGGSDDCVAASSAVCCCGTGAFCGSSIFLHAPTESTRHETRAKRERLLCRIAPGHLSHSMHEKTGPPHGGPASITSPVRTKA